MTCHGGDECAHVAHGVISVPRGDAYRGSFCECSRCALLLWLRHMLVLPASVLSIVEVACDAIFLVSTPCHSA